MIWQERYGRRLAIQVVVKEARSRRGLPSSWRMSLIIWYATFAGMPFCGNLECDAMH